MEARQYVEDKQIQRRIDAIKARMQEIETTRLDTEWIPHNDMSFEWWSIWVLSGYIAWPFAGTHADQPEWLRRDFEGFNEITEHQELYFECLSLEERKNKPHG